MHVLMPTWTGKASLSTLCPTSRGVRGLHFTICWNIFRSKKQDGWSIIEREKGPGPQEKVPISPLDNYKPRSKHHYSCVSAPFHGLVLFMTLRAAHPGFCAFGPLRSTPSLRCHPLFYTTHGRRLPAARHAWRQ